VRDNQIALFKRKGLDEPVFTYAEAMNNGLRHEGHKIALLGSVCEQGGACQAEGILAVRVSSGTRNLFQKELFGNDLADGWRQGCW